MAKAPNSEGGRKEAKRVYSSECTNVVVIVYCSSIVLLWRAIRSDHYDHFDRYDQRMEVSKRVENEFENPTNSKITMNYSRRSF